MRLLVLGGTDFVGRAAVEHALSSGGEVTVLNRGMADRVPGHESVTRLIGDRRSTTGLDAVREGMWDIVFDTWSWEPAAARASAAMLAGRVDRYVYVSSRSVYDAPAAGATENWPVVEGVVDDYAHWKAGAEARSARTGRASGCHENWNGGFCVCSPI